MAMFGEPELSTQLSIQERLNIVSSYLAFCTTSSVLIIIYLHCLIGVYFDLLFITTNSTTNPTTNPTIYIPCNNFTCWGLGSNSTYDDDSFSL